MDCLTMHPVASHWNLGVKRSSDDGAMSNDSRTKRPKFNLAIAGLSKAEQTLLQGAAEILGLTVDQLMAAADRYRSGQSESSSDDLCLQETPSESSGSGDLGRPDQPARGISNEPVRVPFHLTLPDLSQPRWRPSLKKTAINKARSPVTAEPHCEPGHDEGVVPWLDDMLDETLPWNMDFHLDRPTPLALGTPLVHPKEPGLNARGDFLGTQSHVAASNAVSPFSLPSEAAKSSPRHTHDHLSASSTPLGETGLPAHIHRDRFNTSDCRSSESPGQNSVSYPGLTSLPKSAQAKRRSPFDMGQRQQTALVRKLGACIRCSMQKIACKPDPTNLHGCCLTCTDAGRTKLHWFPCLRYKITDADLLDHDKCPRSTWTMRWKKMEMTEISNWASNETKTITCTQDVLGTTFDLEVRRFNPINGDALARKWKSNGREKAFDCPPYAIASMKEAAQALGKFVDSTMGNAICFYIDETDKLMRETYMMAYRQSKIAEREEERRLLVSVLRLWAASRLACRSDRICSTETLGMQTQDFGPDDANSGIILTPPVLSAQMEVIITATLLLPAKNDVLSQLRELIQGSERRSWFAIYLAMFILLHNCALLTHGDNKKARKQGFESRFFRTSLVEGLHNGARVLLAYFHYFNRGSHPFNMDWTSPDSVNCMEMDEEQIHFIQQTTKEIKKRSDMFQKIRHEGLYEDEYFFISQLYDVNWKPIHTL